MSQVIDCHAHYEPRILDEYGLIEKMNRAGVDKAALIPLLTNPPETKKADVLMAVQRAMFNSNLLRPIGISITKSMYKEKGQWNLWLSKGKDSEVKYSIVRDPDNKSVASLVSRHPDRLMSWVFINPEHNDALEQLERWRAVPGMIGVKIHPFWHQFPIMKAEKVARRAEELDLPMLVHLGFDHAGDYQWLTETFPKLKIIFAHLGVPFYRDIWRKIGRRPNVYFDISSTYHVSYGLVKQAVASVGAERLMFGTDSPYAHEDVIARVKQWVVDLPVSDAKKDRIFGENFLEVIHS